MKLETIYVIHHTHTDVGFTNDQPIFWEMQYRFINDALNLINRYADYPYESRFRWTVETTCGLEAWLKTASVYDIDRLIAADRAGLIEVMAMQTNNTPLLDTAQMIESLRPVNRLRRDFGLDIRHAINCDINGQNWTLPDILLDAGIEGFSMAINHHFGGPPNPRPNVFLWQAPSGRVLPTHNGWQYSKANDFGLGNDTDEVFLEWLPKIEAYLFEINYPLPFIILEGFHPYGDNGSAWGGFAEFARRWNKMDRAPRIISATPRMFWYRVKEQNIMLQTIRGDWTDYWNFGCISAARETTINRTSRSRLYRSDALYSSLRSLPLKDRSEEIVWAERTNALYRDAAWKALNLYGEHTWGADMASNNPEYEDSLAMDNHKKNLAYTARSLSLLLERDGLADLSRFIARKDVTDLLIFNPLPWERTISGTIPKNMLIPRGLNDDPTTSRHFLGRMEQPTDFWTGRSGSQYNGGIGWLLSPTKIPAFGYKVVDWEALSDMSSAFEGEEPIIENHRYRITFDKAKGGIVSLWDKSLNREWVDSSAGHPLHGFVHEEVADHEAAEPRKQLCNVNWLTRTETCRGWIPDWKANRTAPAQVVLHKTYRLPFATIVEQILEHPHIDKIYQRTLLPDEGNQIEFQSEWQMGTAIHPEATYLLFPFNIQNSQARFDVGGIPVRTHLDQIPGTCRDYFTTQGWVDFCNGEIGVTIATPENPMVQLGDFHFAHNQAEIHLERAMLLGWVTNNYWETNFPGAQPGVVTARYSILPYAGDFDENRAHCFAAEALHARPVVQHMGEKASSVQFPGSASLLRLPEAPFLTLNLRSAPNQGILLTLFNAGDEPRSAEIKDALIRIKKVQRCDLFGNQIEMLSVENGACSFSMGPRQTITLLLEVSND